MKIRFHSSVVLVAAACAAVLAVAAPARVVRDIPYDPSIGAEGLGDLYLPDDVRPETPLILVIHGGGWSAMSRAGVAGIAEFFQRELGFAAFNIEYRLASAKNPWPACGDDCVSAAKFVLSDAFRAAYGLQHRKIWITGGSAGGHLVLWTLVNLPNDSVAGAISISAISDPTPDFRVHRGRYVPLFGKGVTEEMVGAMNPIPLIRKGMAPLLCTHADTDAVVPIASHRAFADAYRAAGNRCDFYEYRHDAEPNEGGHFIWRPGSNPHKLLACLEARMEKFVREFEKAPPPPQPELLFAADFDGTAKAGVAGGDPSPIPKSRNLKFVPGLRGQALEMKKGMNTALGYKTEGNLNLVRGAVSFWFKPADGVTPGGEERRFYLCTPTASPRAGSGTLWFWKYGPRLRADQSDDGDSYTLLLRPYLTNEWNHVVFTWDEKKGTSIYLNGRKGTRRMSDTSMSGAMKAAAKAPRGGAPGALSFSRRRMFDTFFVGGYGGSAFMDGAMDELRIYSAPLDDDAVRRLYIDGGGCDPEPPPPPDYRAKYANDPPNPFEAPPLAKGGVPGELELVEQVVFDHVPADSNRFVSVGTCRIGNLNGTPYLETDETVHGRFAYRFTLDESTPLYVFEIDYPDDRKRTMDLIVQGCGQTAWDGATGASYALQQGVACGDEYPNTGRIL
ncbi:MAG: alpha/beta hydrolase fold domain-containing protein, partial [Kiritimatiellae bacterium]|nr:alpha/beta hydrolase fold domain-containing protein [Kiritimatiellia bacterium]